MPKSTSRPVLPVSDERFLAQLGIISIQNRIDDKDPLNRHWTSEFTIGGEQYQLVGLAGDFGRPRGVDADFLMALETEFVRQGCPVSNEVVSSAYDLTQMVYGNSSGKHYERLRESLMRLWRVGFTVKKSRMELATTWTRHLTNTLNLIEGVQFWSKDRGDGAGESMDNGRLVVRLSLPLAASIRAGYTQRLNRTLLSRIQQPQGRALYRILSAHRPVEGPLTVTLSDWGALCGVLATQPDRIMRVLDPAHKDLLEFKYLDDVCRVGCGKRSVLHYHYHQFEDADPAHVDLLISAGIAFTVAKELAVMHAGKIEEAVAYARAKAEASKGTRNPVRNLAGLVRNILEEPLKYTITPAVTALQVDLPAQAAQQAARAAAQEAEAVVYHERQQELLLMAGPQQQWDESEKTIRFHSKGLLPQAGLDALKDDCLQGRANAAQVAADLTNLRMQHAGTAPRAEYLSRWQFQDE